MFPLTRTPVFFSFAFFNLKKYEHIIFLFLCFCLFLTGRLLALLDTVRRTVAISSLKNENYK